MTDEAPLYGAKYAVIGTGDFMARILALSEKLEHAQECVRLSGWIDDPKVQIYELVEVSKHG